MRRALSGALWIGLYLAFSLAPLAVVMAGERPPERDFWLEFSIGLGLVGLAMLGLQFFLTARFRRVAAPYGIDIILQFHRQISLVAVGMIVAHPVILFVRDPATLALLNPVTAPWRARLGVLAVVALLALVVISLWRKPLGIGYEVWKASHGLLGLLAVGAALGHIILVGRYVSLPWQQGVWIFMSSGTLALLLYTRLGKPLGMLRRPYRVREVKPERGDSHTVVLEPEGHRGMRFRPGQFAWLKVWASPFSIEEHPFSFSASARGRTHALTVKALGDFTARIGTLEPGTRAYLDGPYGAFTNERYEAPGFVFLAGGIGITPIMSMLRTLDEWGDPRPLLLVYANPDWESVTFREEIGELESRLNLGVVHVLEEPPAGWEGEAGLISPELLERHLPLDQKGRREYFVCGPGPMMDVTEAALSQLGIPPASVHTERFDLV